MLAVDQSPGKNNSLDAGRFWEGWVLARLRSLAIPVRARGRMTSEITGQSLSYDPRKLIGSYPRFRPSLTDAHAANFVREYRLNREGGALAEGMAKRMEQWMHRRIAAQGGGPVLELGAGTLNHLKFESPDNEKDYDIVEPFTELFRQSPSLAKIGCVYRRQSEILSRQVYGRIISIAVLEHMTELPRELAHSGLLLKQDGIFQAGIPSQGGFAWWLGWRCTTGISYWLRNRLDYGVIMRHEHVNSAPEIISLVRYFFDEVSIKRFPLPFHQLSLYAYIEARKPNLSRCEEILAAGCGERVSFSGKLTNRLSPG